MYGYHTGNTMDSLDYGPARLTYEDWELIAEVLAEYAAETEETLSTMNVGDRPYNVVNRIKAIANDINIYILPPNEQTGGQTDG